MAYPALLFITAFVDDKLLPIILEKNEINFKKGEKPSILHKKQCLG